jgi:hypothetical protein
MIAAVISALYVPAIITCPVAAIRAALFPQADDGTVVLAIMLPDLARHECSFDTFGADAAVSPAP